MATLTERTARPERKPLPPPNSDFYQLAETLLPEELAVVKQVRGFMERKVAPIATKYWADEAFPFELLPAFKELNLNEEFAVRVRSAEAKQAFTAFFEKHAPAYDR